MVELISEKTIFDRFMVIYLSFVGLTPGCIFVVEKKSEKEDLGVNPIALTEKKTFW